MVGPLALALDVGLDAGVGVVDALLGARLGGHGEGGHDPAVGVEHIAGDVGRDAVDGVADEVVGRHEEAADEADGGRGAVVQLEDLGVDVSLAAAVTDLESGKFVLVCYLRVEYGIVREMNRPA